MAKTPIILLAGQAGSGKDTVGNYIAQKYNGVCVGQADPLKRFVKNVFGFSEESLWGPSELRNAPVEFSALNIYHCRGFLIEQRGAWLSEVLPGRSAPLELLDRWFDEIERKVCDVGELSPRYALQTLGTDFGRAVSQNMWSDYAIRTCRSLLGRGYTYSRVDGLVTAKDAGYDYAIATDARFSNECLNVSCVNGAVFKISRPGTAAPTSGIAGHQSEKELGDIPRHFFDLVLTNDRTIPDLFDRTDDAMWDIFRDLRAQRANRSCAY